MLMVALAQTPKSMRSVHDQTVDCKAMIRELRHYNKQKLDATQTRRILATAIMFFFEA